MVISRVCLAVRRVFAEMPFSLAPPFVVCFGFLERLFLTNTTQGYPFTRVAAFMSAVLSTPGTRQTNDILLKARIRHLPESAQPIPNRFGSKAPSDKTVPAFATKVVNTPKLRDGNHPIE
jgi:hypothetical protein